MKKDNDNDWIPFFFSPVFRLPNARTRPARAEDGRRVRTHSVPLRRTPGEVRKCARGRRRAAARLPAGPARPLAPVRYYDLDLKCSLGTAQLRELSAKASSSNRILTLPLSDGPSFDFRSRFRFCHARPMIFQPSRNSFAASSPLEVEKISHFNIISVLIL